MDERRNGYCIALERKKEKNIFHPFYPVTFIIRFVFHSFVPKPPSCEEHLFAWATLRDEDDGVFTTDLPPRLLLVELLRGLFALEAHHDVALDRAQRADLGRACRRRHWPDRLLKRRRRRRVAVVSQLAVVQVALEEDEVRAREVEEQVGRLLGHAEKGVARAPERVLLVDPLALRDVLLPPSAETPERLEISLARVLEEAAVHHHVKQPVPVFPGHIRHEPGKALAVEVDRPCEAGLDEEVSVDAIAVKFEASVIKDKVDASTGAPSEVTNDFP